VTQQDPALESADEVKVKRPIPSSAAHDAMKKKPQKGVKRVAEVPAPFLRLYFGRQNDDDDEDDDSRSKAAADERYRLPRKQPQKCVIEVNPALRTEPEDAFVPPPRGDSWVVGTTRYSSALPVCTKRLSSRQRAVYEKQQDNASGKPITVLFPVKTDAVLQTGALPQPLVVKPTNKHILLSIIDRLHKLKHPPST